MATLLALILFAGAAQVVDASAFRGNTPEAALGRMSLEELRATIIDELMSAVGNGKAEQRLSSIEDSLRPTFLSMPKNAYGNLEHSAVRYVLHRLFVQRHGMYVKGLEPGMEALDAPSTTALLDDKIPAYVQAVFEERLNGRGLGMHEIAILAATLEHLIHNEAVHRLEASYHAHGLLTAEAVSAQQAETLIDTYMVIFILGKNVSLLTLEAVMQDRAAIQSIYPTWSDTQKFVRDVREEVAVAAEEPSEFSGSKYTFRAITRVVEEIGERYGRWQDSECQDLKGALMQIEEGSTGRVPLKNFYGNALGGAWQFTESVDYLRQLGALDETDSERKSVLISNYINAPTNCLASSGIYSVCCMNECEALLGYVEKAVGAPDAQAQVLIDLIGGLASSTADAPRKLSATLQALLDEVASHHGGRVPIHGRLFAQWLHHAYPRECPYPHKVGTTTLLTADQWMIETGASSVAEINDMQSHVDEFEAHAKAGEAVQSSSALMWSAEEELVVPPAKRVSPLQRIASMIAIACLLFSGATGLKHLLGLVEKQKLALPYAGKQHFC